MSKFPRDIVISPGFGAGIATWCGELSTGKNGYDVAECPEFVAYVRDTPQDERDGDAAIAVLVAAGVASESDHVYMGGLGGAEVVTVHGPYAIEEYDGSESIREQADSEYWRA